MADANANIRIGVDTSAALAQIKSLQRQIALFHSSMANSGKAAADQSARMQSNLVNSINATRGFSAQMTTVKSSTESFTNALEKNKLSLGQTMRFAGASTKTFGKLFKSEFNTINKVARERVKDLQTQYVKMGRDANGAMQAIKVRPTTLDMQNFGTKTAIAAQKTQLLGQLLKQGSTNLLNWGKNTQWAGRQLMVGFTIPLTIFGAIAAKTFMKLEEQAIRFKRVYGDMFTSDKEVDEALAGVRELAEEFTKFGVTVEDTINLAASVAQMGGVGEDLKNQVREATRLSVLGGIEQQEALDTTISLTNAFGVATEDLSDKVAFLNAVENQTILSISDFNEAIPKAGSVVKQLGGDVEDLAYFLTAMREGGINASQSANALKSSLARLINPTEVAVEKMSGFGINILGIVNDNAGNLKETIQVLAVELDKLDPLDKARAVEQLFGKFQFARMSTLFENIVKEGSQANKVLDITTNSTEELAIIAERELGKVAESPLFKFKKALEELKVALAPIGKAFLELAAPILDFAKGVLEQFNNLSDGAKQFIVGLTTIAGVVAPAVLMVVGLIANAIANTMKLGLVIRNAFGKAGQSSNFLTDQFEYMNQEQIEGAAVAASLDQAHAKLRQTFTSESAAVDKLSAAYTRAIAKQNKMMMSGPGAGARGARRARGFNSGTSSVPGYNQGVISVPGSGNKDTVPAMLTPGEAVIPKEMAKKYGPLIDAMIANNIPGYNEGTDFSHIGPGARVPVSQALADPKITPNQSTRLRMETLQELDPNAAVDLKHSFGTRMTRKTNIQLASKRGASAGSVAQEFTGKNIDQRYGDVFKLTGADGKDPQLQKEFANYDKAMSSKIKGLQKTGTTNIVDTEEQWKKLPKAQQKTTRSLESLDKEVVKGIGKDNKRFTQTRRKALGTIRDVRIGPTGLSPGAAERAIANPEKYRRILRKRRGKLAVGTSNQAPSAGGFGEFPTQASEFNDGLADSAQTKSESKRTRKIAKDTVDGYANELKRGKGKVKQTAKEKAKLEEQSRQRLYGGGQPTPQERAARKQEEKRAKRQAAEQRRTAKLRADQNKRMYGTQSVTPEMRAERKRQESLEKQRRRVLKQQQQNNQVQTKVIQAEQVNAKKLSVVGRLRERMLRRKQARLTREQALMAREGAMQAGGRGGGAGRMAGIGMGASSAVMMGSMLPGQIGQTAQSLMMPVMALSMVLPMLTNGIGVVVAALAGLGASIWYMNSSFNKGAEEGMKMAEAFSVGKDAMRDLAKAAGNVSAPEIMEKRREDAMQGFNIAPGKQTFGETFLQDEEGEAMLGSLKEAAQSTGGNMSAIKSAVVNQMGTAIATGALSAGQARSIVSELGQELNDFGFSIDVNGQLLSMFGPDGSDLLKDPLKLRVQLIEETRRGIRASAGRMGPASNEAAMRTAGNVAIGGTGGAIAGRLAATQTQIGRAAAGGIAKIGAKAIGRTAAMTAAGSVVPVIGNVVGAVAGIGLALFDAAKYMEDLGVAAGGFVATGAMALQQQKDLLDSLDLEYETRIQNALAADDTAEAARLENQYLRDRQALLDENAKTSEILNENFDNLDAISKFATKDVMNDAVMKMFEDDPIQTMVADSALKAIDELDFGEFSEREFALKMAIMTEGVSPDKILGLLDAFGDEGATMYMNLEARVGQADAGRALQIADMFGNVENQKNFLMQVSSRESEDARAFVDLFQDIGKYGEVMNLEVALDYYLNDPNAAERLSGRLQEIRNLVEQNEGELRIETFAPVFDNPEAGEALLAYAEEFEKLSPQMQVEFIQAFTTLYTTEGDPAELENFRREMGDPDATKADLDVYRGDRITHARGEELGASPLEEEDTGGGGGGGGPKASDLDGMLKKLRDIRDSTIEVTKGWVASRNKLDELFGDGNNIKIFGGIEQQMRSLGLGQDLIKVIVGMDPDEYERRKDELFQFDDAGNIVGVTTALGNMGRALRAVALGEFQNEQERVLSGLNDQFVAMRKLTAAGMSTAAAYEAVKDSAFAAAVAREKDNDVIRETIKLYEKAEERTRAFQAAQALANKNQETQDLRGTVKFIEQNARSLSEAQKNAIMNDPDLQTLIMDPRVDPKTLTRALENAEKQADLDLRVKKLTFEGLTDIFNEGFNKAMEAFSVQEKEIELDFDVKKDPFLEAIKEAEQDISDIRNKAGGLDDLQADLERISWQEEQINKSYDQRVDALDKVKTINEDLAQQQKSQLDVAEALSRGDIAAAARAVQELRKQKAESTAKKQEDQLEISREKALVALVGNMGKTRKELEEEIKQLNREIFNIEEQRLEPAQRQIELLTRTQEELVDGLMVLGKTREEWERLKNRVDLARISSEQFIKSMQDALDVVKDIVDYWDNFPTEKHIKIFQDVQPYGEEEEEPEELPAPDPKPDPSTGPGDDDPPPEKIDLLPNYKDDTLLPDHLIGELDRGMGDVGTKTWFPTALTGVGGVPFTKAAADAGGAPGMSIEVPADQPTSFLDKGIFDGFFDGLFGRKKPEQTTSSSVPQVPRTPDGKIDYNALPEPTTAGFSGFDGLFGGGQSSNSGAGGSTGGTYTGVSGVSGRRHLPQSIGPLSNLPSSIPSAPAALKGASAGPAGSGDVSSAIAGVNRVEGQIASLGQKTPTLLQSFNDFYNRAPETTRPPLEEGVAGNISSVGNRAPLLMAGFSGFFGGPLRTAAEEGIEAGVAEPLQNTSDRTPSLMSRVLGFFTGDIPKATDETFNRKLPDHLTGLANKVPGKLSPIQGFFDKLPGKAGPKIENDLASSFIRLAVLAPLVLQSISTWFQGLPFMPSVRGAIIIGIPSMFNQAADLSITMLRIIENYFRMLPLKVRQLIQPISTMFYLEGKESAERFIKEVNRQFNNFKPVLEITRKIITIYETQIRNQGGLIHGYNMGGSVSGFNEGGGYQNLPMSGRVPGSGSYDKVKTLLTPGEFVIRKEAVAKYGEGLMQMINSAKLSTESFSAPTFDTSSKSYSSPNTETKQGEVMYNNNYAINVNVKSDANPDQIARTVMQNIKKVDSQRIRSNRL